ncbi:MAG: hypothetical protein IT330_18085 [Anaerolineae bacterium]|nr:hypothetical protein [Anaerolineae bacterium]
MATYGFDLEEFWDAIFSEDAARIIVAWQLLSVGEQEPVREHLRRILTDPERVPAQRVAAGVALRVIAEREENPL